MQKLVFIVFCLFHILLLPVFLGLLGIKIYGDIIFGNENNIILFLFIILIPLKFFIIPIFYELADKNDKIYIYLEKIKNKYFASKILIFSILIDILSMTISLIKIFTIEYFDAIVICYILSMGGLFTSYLSLIIWFKIRQYINLKNITYLSFFISLGQYIINATLLGYKFILFGLWIFLPSVLILGIWLMNITKELKFSKIKKIILNTINFYIIYLIQIIIFSLIILYLGR